MSEELSGDSSNRLSSIMNLDYEAPEDNTPEEEVAPDDTKPAPSNEQPKEKVKANAAKTDKKPEAKEDADGEEG